MWNVAFPICLEMRPDLSRPTPDLLTKQYPGLVDAPSSSRCLEERVVVVVVVWSPPTASLLLGLQLVQRETVAAGNARASFIKASILRSHQPAGGLWGKLPGNSTTRTHTAFSTRTFCECRHAPIATHASDGVRSLSACRLCWCGRALAARLSGKHPTQPRTDEQTLSGTPAPHTKRGARAAARGGIQHRPRRVTADLTVSPLPAVLF